MYLVRLAGKNQHAIHVEILGSDPHCTFFFGQEPPGGGRRWDVVVYKMIGGHRFRLEVCDSSPLQSRTCVPCCITHPKN